MRPDREIRIRIEQLYAQLVLLRHKRDYHSAQERHLRAQLEGQVIALEWILSPEVQPVKIGRA